MSNQIINRVNLNKELYNIKTYGDKIDLTLDNITKYLSQFIDKYNKVLGRLDGLEEALELIKDSLDELDGGTTSSVVFAFKASDSKPTRPSDLTLTPQTWSSVMPETDKPIYQVMALRIGDELTTWSDGNVWTPPIRITGKDGANSNKLEIYYRTASNTAPSTPQFSVDSIINSANGLTSAGKVTTATYDAWYVERKGITSEYTREYASFSTLQDDGTWSNWSKPYLVAAYGSDGSNGYGVEYVYRLSNKKYPDLRINENNSVSQELLQTYTDANGTHWNEPGFIPTDNKPFDGYKWSNEMYEVSKNNLYCYVSSRRMINYKGQQVWEGFSKPKCQYIYSVSDGSAVDVNIGIVLKTVYRKGTSATQVVEGAPLNSNGTFNGSYDFETKILTPPDGWSLTPDIDSLQENEYMFFSDKIFLMENDDNLWSDPKMMFGKPETADNAQVTVYAKSSSGAESLWTNYCLNRDGQGLGTFDFDTHQVTFESPLNTVWYQNIDNVIDEAGTPIYSSTKNFYTNDLTKPWSSPIRYIMPGDIIESSASNSVSFGAAIYKAVVSGAPSKPVFNVDLNQQFDFTKGVLVENAVKAIGWQLTPELAAEALNETKYIVYVSYNNYICDRDSEGNVIEDFIRETGWTDPIKYINIDKILSDVEQVAQDAANEAINNASTDLTDATKVLNQARVDIAEAKDDLAKAKQFLGDGYTAFINGEGSNLTVLMAQLATKDELTGYVTTSTYEQTAASIKQQVSAEYAQQNEELIRTAVGEITADYIRQQVTEVVGEDVVTTAQLEIKANEIKSQIASDISNTTTTIGQKIDEIRLAASQQAVNDITNKINTGTITVKPGGISLVVAEGTTAGGATSKAVINLTIKDSASQTAITSDTIVLNGDTIAASIAAKELNIDNFTYLFNKKQAETRSDKAMAIFGANTSGTSRFSLDGSGQLAGGLITWGNGVGDYNTSSNFGLSVSGHIEAHSGYIGNENAGWEIGTLTEGSSTYPALLGTSNNNSRIVLSTEFVESTTGSLQNWCLRKDGTGQIARGNIAWTLSGSNKCNLTIKGNTYIEAAYIGSGSDVNKLLWIGTQNNQAFISASDGTNGLIITTDYFAAGAASRAANGYLTNSSTWGWQLNADGSGQLGQGSITWQSNGNLNIEGDFTCSTYLNSVPAWKLSNDGNAQIGGGLIDFKYNPNGGTLTVTGNIIANRLTLGGTNGAVMNFETYNETVHGVATNGFSYIDNGEPILFGEYNNSHYCVPLLKMGGSSGVTYQECKMYKITNTSATAVNIYSLITGNSFDKLFRVKEGSSYVYRTGSITGPKVTADTYISYQKAANMREVHKYPSGDSFSPKVYCGEDTVYRIRVFEISNGTITKAYDTYIAKIIYITVAETVQAGAAIDNYTLSIDWEFVNPEGTSTYPESILVTPQNSGNLGEGRLPPSQTLTYTTVTSQTISGAYRDGLNTISTDSTPFDMASGGISGDSGSSGTSVELVTSLSTSGISTKAYSCSAFNSLLYSASVVKTAQAANTINIDGVAYTIVICDSVPSTKDEHTIYLVKE